MSETRSRRPGKDLAAPIPVEDLVLLKDAQEVERILARSKARGEKPIRWETAKKKLGL